MLVKGAKGHDTVISIFSTLGFSRCNASYKFIPKMYFAIDTDEWVSADQNALFEIAGDILRNITGFES